MEARGFVKNPRYSRDRRSVLAALDSIEIDEPISDIISGFMRLPYCFSLQSCYGHFLHSNEKDIKNLNPLPLEDCGKVRYRIAYIALCLQNSPAGISFRDEMAEIPKIAPQYIQFGSAGWFWKRYPNSYVLQVEPERYRDKDEALLDYAEALRVQECRNSFFAGLRRLLNGQEIESKES